MLPLLTGFIPAFNGASYIQDAIESVISSSTADLEIVVVDDGWEIDPSVMVHKSAALRDGVVDNDLLEQITETDDRFERWRAREGGALDRRIMDLVSSLQRESR